MPKVIMNIGFLGTDEYTYAIKCDIKPGHTQTGYKTLIIKEQEIHIPAYFYNDLDNQKEVFEDDEYIALTSEMSRKVPNKIDENENS